MEVSVPKFGKIPWLSEASLINKPLVLSLPKRYPQNSGTFLISSKKDMNLPILFQVPDVLSKARRIQSNPMLIRNKQLCSTCQEIKMVQPKPVIIPHNLKLSFENLMSHRMSLHPPKAQAVLKHSHNDISTAALHYSYVHLLLIDKRIASSARASALTCVSSFRDINTGLVKRAFTTDCPFWAPGQLSSMNCWQIPMQLCRRHNSLPCPERSQWARQ
ncbi:uncharacterized protein C1orf105 homolog isoform X2 [Canis lupus familiaris]|uniref:Chromosome 7 C1orf105 homolog n=1 Tax=Canis lupus familiaris TaxID=9615 RepID=A0A8I3RZK9_CANLF|nr:uncharacterized protein C1orf105 homolog isoform X2 [Canis lupus familiaris]XP_025286108.1 uncharacterized protein C1orf105 homolog isoform X2 [Canis lupus dingo]XP_038398449.1 uncharacterized protein C1orf105 homolog isoform X2 [Canis lupus familiaris]XP_038527277.1 uncharacterized protein C1orf105 homolog isoform X2 [Canis lupus familiaris]|eukprot:XP_022276766.1 uncharacterized protein C1orf105 homolog isoform X2 [Canis lupus familiaris]